MDIQFELCYNVISQTQIMLNKYNVIFKSVQIMCLYISGEM